MAVLNGSAATEGFDMVDVNEINFANQDAGNNSTTEYSWITGNAHDVQVTGSGIANNGTSPTSGTVTQVDIDLSNNNFATPDIVITGVANASLTTITGTSLDFLNGVFGGDDQITGTSFADQLKGVGGNDAIDGGDGGDTIFGGLGDDTLDGEGGSNELIGDAGNDFLFDGDGNDTIDGGADDDYVVVESAVAFDSFDGDTGVDTIDWTGSTQVGATFDLTAGTAVSGADTETMIGFENLKGTGGADNISGSGSNNILFGGGGNDTVDGLGGDDTVDGQGGDDVLTDSGGDDSILGDAGDDIITESSVSGVDTIDGGANNDTVFVGSAIGADSFAGGAGVDRPSSPASAASVHIARSTTFSLRHLSTRSGGAWVSKNFVTDASNMRMSSSAMKSGRSTARTDMVDSGN